MIPETGQAESQGDTKVEPGAGDGSGRDVIVARVEANGGEDRLVEEDGDAPGETAGHGVRHLVQRAPRRSCLRLLGHLADGVRQTRTFAQADERGTIKDEG